MHFDVSTGFSGINVQEHNLPSQSCAADDPSIRRCGQSKIPLLDEE